MEQGRLFGEAELGPEGVTEAAGASQGRAVRVVRPVRNQGRMEVRTLEEALPAEHLARDIWEMVERLPLEPFYATIKSEEEGPGRPASDPRVLLALWVYATSQGVGSARELARLCEEHGAYRWLRGQVPVNYHMLSDFRVSRRAELDELLSEILASLMGAGLVQAQRVAQDGLRLRAKAGAKSFRRRERLEEYLKQARQQVERLSAQEEGSKREERQAQERQRRVEAALGQLAEVEAIKKRQQRKLEKGRREKVGEARASTSDPEARVMKMGDGGYRPALNAQIATDMDSQVIVGVGIVNQGTDHGLGAPMEVQVAERCGRHPRDYVMDGGFVSLADVVTLSERGVSVCAPSRPPTGEKRQKDPTQPRETDAPAVAEWRKRMGSEEGKQLYRKRAATAECVNAQIEGRYGLRQLPVVGLAKSLSVLLLVAVTHNLLRWLALTT